MKFTNQIYVNLLFFIVIYFMFTNKVAATEHSSFDDYKIIIERNIFDPNRNAIVVELEPTSKSLPIPPLKLEYIILTGAIVTKNNNITTLSKEVIFVEGSKPEYRVTLSKGMQIAGFEIGEIKTSSAEFIKDNNTIVLNVGQSISGNKEREWKISD